MARNRTIVSTGRRILIIDDNVEYLASTKRIVERDGHEVLTAAGGREALELLRSRTVDLVLVDYFMPGMTGEDFVRELRTFNRFVQVILQTGYASEQPPREMLRRLDIQGYHDKSDGPDKLCLWVDVGLKAAFTFQLLEKSRLGLRHILGATPELHRIQALGDLLQGILLQTAGLLGAVDSFVAVMSSKTPPLTGEGFVALVEDGDLRIQAATGRFRTGEQVEKVLDAERTAAIHSALQGKEDPAAVDGTVAALRIGEQAIGAIYLDRPALDTNDRELLTIFANQAAVAIKNVSLYEAAAIDPLSGVFARRFFEQALARELRSAYRSGSPVGLLLVDLDGMKRINDVGGHLAGDRAVAATGNLLRRATRANDAVGRYGGDEFVVLLPGADASGVAIVAARIADAFTRLSVEGTAGPMAVRGSVGGAVLVGGKSPTANRSKGFFDEAAVDLVRAADAALYDAKRDKHLAFEPQTRGWPTTEPEVPARASKPPSVVFAEVASR